MVSTLQPLGPNSLMILCGLWEEFQGGPQWQGALFCSPTKVGSRLLCPQPTSILRTAMSPGALIFEPRNKHGG